MKTKRTFTVLLACLVAMPGLLLAQTAKEAKELANERKVISQLSEKELNSKASKAARKEAKKLSKEGWRVTPGALPMDKQLDRCYQMQYAYEEGTYPKYIMTDAMSIGENYDAAKRQALELSKEMIAAQVQTELTALVENTVANKQLESNEAASLAQTISASKNLILQRLSRVTPVMECYRSKSNKNKEVLVRVSYNAQAAMESAKQVVREQLEQKGEDLHRQLDKVLGF